jgi:[acyl-carrier-protein] S-malonyltransferase
MMAGAADALRQALTESEITTPAATRILANINADYYSGPAAIADGLAQQLTSPILWQKCMERLLSEQVEQFYEIGPGRVLTGLMRRINRKTRVVNVSSAEALQALLKTQ